MSDNGDHLPAPPEQTPEGCIVQAFEPSSNLEELWQQALSSLRLHRGGAELLATEFAGVDGAALLHRLIADGNVWIATTASTTSALLVLRDGVADIVFVSKPYRRQGLATKILAMVNDLGLLVDARVLPGDRATKSLFESIGWKARLLTMRDARRGDEPS